MPIDAGIAGELQAILHARGFYEGPVTGQCDADLLRNLHDFMGWESYDARIRDDDRIDLEVLGDIRRKHQRWLAGQGGALIRPRG